MGSYHKIVCDLRRRKTTAPKAIDQYSHYHFAVSHIKYYPNKCKQHRLPYRYMERVNKKKTTVFFYVYVL